MKKILLIVAFVFSSTLITTADTNKLESIDTIEIQDSDCWEFADLVEAYICGGTGCSFDIWGFYYWECMGPEYWETEVIVTG